MRVVITGAHGQVGHELVNLAPDRFTVIPLGSNELNIANLDAVNKVIPQLKPDIIINAAAYTAVDKAESEPDKAYAVNRDGVANLGLVANGLDIPLLHISTDYVFSGDATKPYVEDDIPCPTGIYGVSKLAGEQALIKVNPRHLVLRTSWVFGFHGNNFVKTMLRLGQERKNLSIVSDQIGCPTSAISIAQTLWGLVEEYDKMGRLYWGVYHFAGLPACSWYDFATEIFQQAHGLGLLQEQPVIKSITTKHFPTPAKRPAYSVLSGNALQSMYGISPVNWRSDLRAMLLEFFAAR